MPKRGREAKGEEAEYDEDDDVGVGVDKREELACMWEDTDDTGVGRGGRPSG